MESLVSIVLPTYNRKEMVKNAIKSVVHQTYQNWELIVVDDASMDDISGTVNEFKDARIHYTRNEKNLGSNYSRNRGASLATGDYIAFLDSDNEWMPEKLEKQIAEFEKRKELELVFCKIHIKDGEDEREVPNEEIQDLKEIMVYRNVVDTNSALMKKDAFERVGRFDERITRLQDWDLFFRFIVVYEYPVLFLDECLDINYISPDSISKNNWKLFDSMTYFMIKYEKWYNSMSAIGRHVAMMLHEARNDAEYNYAYRKKLELISRNDNLLNEYIQQKEGKTRQFDEKQIAEKYKSWYQNLYNWKRRNARQGSIVSNYLKENKIKSVAIYGLGKWGELIYEEAKDVEEIYLCGIDEKKKEFHGIPIKRKCDELNEIEVIIISVFMEYEAIKLELEKIGYIGKVVSILELIYR